ncbi:enoyl-CoA hydratase/isomerase family protein [Microbacterium sp. F51-2R]|uniref:enoyl-CoA hydratase/isomerase family protein n=1 Tax=Microbacterium sp. F51-2R TaxID=3445777 RepID=UPI003F9F07B4
MTAGIEEEVESASVNLYVEEGVATIEICNPAQRNALTRSMCIALKRIALEADSAPDVDVIVLRGAGDTFCAGAAIGELSSILFDDSAADGPVDRLSLADEALSALRKPSLALVDGACMGGGWQIASACDFIVASARSAFAITPAKLGVLYPRSGIERLIRLVGPAAAKYILFSAETFTAQQALALGLIADVFDDSEFSASGMWLARLIRSRSQFSVQTMKEIVDLTVDGSDHLDATWREAWAQTTAGPDMSIGVAAFQSRSRPRFRWRPTPHI